MENAFNRESASEVRAKGISTPFQISLHSLQLAFLLLSTIVGFEACQEKPKTETIQFKIQQTSFSQKQKPANPVLSEYEQFLLHLDSSDVTNVSQAANKYATLFKGQPQTSADSGYVLFDKFYDRISYGVNESYNPDHYDSLILNFGLPAALDHSKELREFNRRINANGYQIAMSEGITYLQQDRDFITKHFYSYVSPVLQQYLTQLNKENKEGFAEDAGLTIGPTQFADRIIWRESFLTKNPGFILKEEVEKTNRHYLYAFLTGMDNSPVLSYDNNKLDVYYADAYKYLGNKAPNSAANQLVQPYFKALLKADTAQANTLLKRYESEGKIGY